MSNSNNCFTPINIRLINIHSIEIERLQARVKEKYGLSLFRSEIFKIALNDFLEDINNEEDLEKKLQENRLI
nr:hypothetical protein [Methanobrevibacter arboriphilus]